MIVIQDNILICPVKYLNKPNFTCEEAWSQGKGHVPCDLGGSDKMIRVARDDSYFRFLNEELG